MYISEYTYSFLNSLFFVKACFSTVVISLSLRSLNTMLRHDKVKLFYYSISHMPVMAVEKIM